MFYGHLLFKLFFWTTQTSYKIYVNYTVRAFIIKIHNTNQPTPTENRRHYTRQLLCFPSCLEVLLVWFETHDDSSVVVCTHNSYTSKYNTSNGKKIYMPHEMRASFSNDGVGKSMKSALSQAMASQEVQQQTHRVTPSPCFLYILCCVYSMFEPSYVFILTEVTSDWKCAGFSVNLFAVHAQEHRINACIILGMWIVQSLYSVASQYQVFKTQCSTVWNIDNSPRDIIRRIWAWDD